jgi:hypothetical protein
VTPGIRMGQRYRCAPQPLDQQHKWALILVIAMLVMVDETIMSTLAQLVTHRLPITPGQSLKPLTIQALNGAAISWVIGFSTGRLNKHWDFKRVGCVLTLVLMLIFIAAGTSISIWPNASH